MSPGRTPPCACALEQTRLFFGQGLNLGAIGAETDRRGYVPVSDKMEVLDKAGKPVPNVYCIGDANGARALHSSQVPYAPLTYACMCSSRDGTSAHSTA